MSTSTSLQCPRTSRMHCRSPAPSGSSVSINSVPLSTTISSTSCPHTPPHFSLLHHLLYTGHPGRTADRRHLLVPARRARVGPPNCRRPPQHLPLLAPHRAGWLWVRWLIRRHHALQGLLHGQGDAAGCRRLRPGRWLCRWAPCRRTGRLARQLARQQGRADVHGACADAG